MTSDESSAIAACQAGDLSQFDPLYRQYVERIYAYIYRRTLVRQTAEDITSVTFMKALRSIQQFDAAKGTFSGWLYRIARNAITDHYRSHREVSDIDDVWDLSSDNDVHREAEAGIDYDQIREALASLEPAKRDILLMRLWDGLSYAEIAAITGKTETNCKVTFSRTIAALRKDLPLAAFLLLFTFPLHL